VGDTLEDCVPLRLAFDGMDEHLERDSPRPLVIAVSGGGDSLFLLLAAKAWADTAKRRIVAVTVDHELHPDSPTWALWCRERAQRLGVKHHTLLWEGAKPATGLPAAARAARHGLLADWARSAGAVAILMGHTADDGLEARQMRATGASTPEARTWSPSPVWPAGRDVFILRPLLRVRRAQIRAALKSVGECWVEDPSNADMKYARARARWKLEHGLADCVELPSPMQAPLARQLLQEVVADEAGGLTIPREALVTATSDAARTFLGAALLCVGGQDRPPRRTTLGRLLERLTGANVFSATLAGARVDADQDRITLIREAGEMVRTGRRLEVGLPQRRGVSWDGRFEIEARASGLRVLRLAGLACRLSSTEHQHLRRFAPAARRTLPAIVDGSGLVFCPILAGDERVEIRPLVFARLAAACGALVDEGAARRMAQRALTS